MKRQDHIKSRLLYVYQVDAVLLEYDLKLLLTNVSLSFMIQIVSLLHI